jgi:hypothetical protein
MIIQGNVGIGTTDPQTNLHIDSGSVGTIASLLLREDANEVFLRMTTNNGQPQMIWDHNDSLSFGTTDSSNNTSGSQIFRIDNDGNIAIGTDGSPDAKLEVSAGGGAADLFMLSSNDGNDGNRFIVKNIGNVGIGTTSPFAKLSVTGAGTGTGKAFQIADSADTPRFTVQDDGNVGIGTASPGARLDIVAPAAADLKGLSINMSSASGGNVTAISVPAFTGGANGTTNYGLNIGPITGTGSSVNYGIYIGKIDNTTSSDRFLYNLYIAGTTAAPKHYAIYSDATAQSYIAGNVGIGTTSPWRKLSVAGTVGFDGLTGSTGASSLCLDSSNQVVYNSGSDACLSSTRDTKHDIENLSLEGLEIVNRLNPVSFVYNQGDGRTRYGFIAEDAAEIAPSLATYNASSSITGIDDRAILSVVVKAIKELWAYVREQFASQDSRISALEAEVAALKAQLGEGRTASDDQIDDGSAPMDTAPPATTPSGPQSHANGSNGQQTVTSSPTAATSTTSTPPPAPDVEPSSPEDQATAANDNEPTASADTPAETVNSQLASSTPPANDNMPVLGAASSTASMSTTTAAH